MKNFRAFELIFSNEGKIIANMELDVNSLRFIDGDVYQYGKKLDRDSILLTK